MIAAMNKAGSILIGMQKTETKRRMTAYRAQKTMVGYNTEKSLLYAQELVMLFNSPENSIADREKYIEGDRLTAEMATALRHAAENTERCLSPARQKWRSGQYP